MTHTLGEVQNENNHFSKLLLIIKKYYITFSHQFDLQISVNILEGADI